MTESQKLELHGLGLSVVSLNLDSFEKILHDIQEVRREVRDPLLLLCEGLDIDSLNNNLEQRIGMVRLASALLPESTHLIERWLKDKNASEVHFTLFCYLDWVSRQNQFSDQVILNMVREYLLAVSSNRGTAAWMAGDLLGDHWKSRSAVDTLIAVALGGRYVAGRQAALHGIRMRMESVPKGSPEWADLFQCLVRVQRQDRSGPIRSTAEWLIEHHS